MIASTGTRVGDTRDIETSAGDAPKATSSPSEKDATTLPQRSYIARRLIDGESFEAGQFGTYASMFLLVIGQSTVIFAKWFRPSKRHNSFELRQCHNLRF